MQPPSVYKNEKKWRAKATIIFFFFGLLGIIISMAMGLGEQRGGSSTPNVGYGFKYVFMALVWVPIGTLLSLVASFINRCGNYSWRSAVIVAFLSGVAFFYGIIFAAYMGGGLLFVLIPPAFFVFTSLLLKFIGNPAIRTK